MSDRYIMIVEDNPDDEALTLRALMQSNVANSVMVARDGEEALDYLFGKQRGAEADRRPAVILLDLKLPKVDGIEVLQRIRADERTRLTPVVMLTSSKEESDVIRSYTSGANGYVRKPVDFVQFAEAVEEVGLYWVVVNEPPPHHAVLAT